jgi:hypothetical protein
MVDFVTLGVLRSVSDWRTNRQTWLLRWVPILYDNETQWQKVALSLTENIQHHKKKADTGTPVRKTNKHNICVELVELWFVERAKGQQKTFEQKGVVSSLTNLLSNLCRMDLSIVGPWTCQSSVHPSRFIHSQFMSTTRSKTRLSTAAAMPPINQSFSFRFDRSISFSFPPCLSCPNTALIYFCF